MPARVSPTDRIRCEIDALFAADRDLGEVLEEVARLGARLILQTALEAEVTEFLGRERYSRGDRARRVAQWLRADHGKDDRGTGRAGPSRGCVAPTRSSRHDCSARV